MLRRYGPLKKDHLLLSDSETDSDDLSVYVDGVQGQKQKNKQKNAEKESSKNKKHKKAKSIDQENYEDKKKSLKKLSGKYQEYMKQFPIPTSVHESLAAFNTWQDLGKSMKKIYGQPLHYLTHLRLKQWDDSRIGNKDENKPLDTIIHRAKAESTIWVMEEFHRNCSSREYIAKLWLADPTYYNLI
ncbi:DUF1950 domain-containing protein, partial [Cephalotus follicularis]